MVCWFSSINKTLFDFIFWLSLLNLQFWKFWMVHFDALLAFFQKNFGHSLVPWMNSLDYWTISVTWWSIEYWLPFNEGMITSRDWNSTTNRSWNPNIFKADCSDMANCQKCNFGHSLVSSMPSLDYSTISTPWWSIEYWLLFHEGMITSHDWN